MSPLSFNPLRSMVYPGRGIILGKDPSGERRIAVYFITGRSPSSQARMLVRDGDAVWTKPTDPDVLRRGNPDLLIYPAVISSGGLAVSNGRQTSDIAAGFAERRTPREILSRVLENWEYEPDAPIFTPRISGCVTADGSAALSLIFRSETGATVRELFDVPPGPGRGALLTTYSGETKDPIRAFRGNPLEVDLESSSAGDLCAAVYDALGPRPGSPDYRVAVACLVASSAAKDEREMRIINRHERTGDHGEHP